MGTRLAPGIPAAKPTRTGFGPGNGSGAGGDGGGNGSFPKPLPLEACRLGMWLALAAITMLFVAMTSAYVVRLGFDPDWRAIRMPPILLVNTVVLFASSVTMERARRTARREWLAVTLLLGLSFLGGQLAAWRQLSTAGIYLGTNPHSSFFYLLTGLHGLHLLGGVLALSYVAFSRLPQERSVNVTAIYWHFMDGLWIYLVVLLFGWR